MTPRYETDRQYIQRRCVTDVDGCWRWLLAVDKDGYGKSKAGRAHRMSYEIYRGPIPDGLMLDHLCRKPGCVNPAHLEPVVAKVNTARGIVAERSSAEWQPGGVLREAHYRRFAATATHCPNGHLRADHESRVGRERHLICRACCQERTRRYYSDPAKRDRRNALKRERRAAGIYR